MLHTGEQRGKMLGPGCEKKAPGSRGLVVGQQQGAVLAWEWCMGASDICSCSFSAVSEMHIALSAVGASDACSCVSVMLELARTIIASREVQLAAPVVFLINGGEETLSQAANGFMASSRWDIWNDRGQTQIRGKE